MDKVLLISEEKIKKYTLVNDNVDGQYLQVAIQSAQEIDLNNLIGPVLYEKIINDIKMDTLTAPYKLLVDEYITPYLCWQVMSTIQVATNYKLTNSGTIQNNDDKKSAVEYNNGRALCEQFAKYANAYATKMKNFLQCNASTYPEYRQCKNYEWAEDTPLCSIFLEDIPSRKYDYKYK